jgi:nucleotide-binding universal stress UspA family protein
MTAKKSFAKKIEKILWATDFSQESRHCLPYVKFFADAVKAKNYALYVLPKFSDWIYETAFLSDDELFKTIDNTRQNSLNKMEKYSKQSGLSMEPRVIEGRFASEEIISYANDNNVDLILAGRRGISEIEQILIGSTTSRLIRKANIPVLVIPRAKKNAKIGKILCPIDLGDFSMMELEYAIALAEQLRAVLYVIHVSEFFSYKIPIFARDKLIEKINNKIKEMAEARNYRIEDENIIHEVGEPAQKIMETAGKKKIDVITMATHQRKGIEKFFLGSITEKVLMYSDTPVIVLPPAHP